MVNRIQALLGVEYPIVQAPMTYIARAELAATDSGTILLDVPGNPTMRVLRTGLAARVAAHDPDVQLLGKVTDLYFDGDMDASVANTGQVSSRISHLLPVAEIVRGTWLDIEAALDGARSRL